MNISPINTERDHAEAIAEIGRLIALDPSAESAEASRLDVLSTLVEAYEAKTFPISAADAVDAIQFRMEQEDLAPRDLAPLLGGRSKVSEVLARKRPLTVSMMRALQDSLGIPASLLLRTTTSATPDDEGSPASRGVITEMIRRGWISDQQEVATFFERLGPATVALRKGQHIRSARQMNTYALRAWVARIAEKASAQDMPAFDIGSLDNQALKNLVHLSVRQDGPKAAQEFLRQYGIAMIVESHLPQTYLDGAAVLIMNSRPVIGMTVRYDRLDNFWFTLLHEVAHIILHSSGERSLFIDDLDVGAQNDTVEREADAFAGEVLVPSKVWRDSPASRQRSATAATHLAANLGIHPAIVAGKMRHHWKAFRLLNNLVGHHQVRTCFPEVIW
ncbi:MAG TPA: ImmA/IrrE family metallo-endopeptidase [Chthoniobacterales bacterium]|nr:ImmA/IrrE family metallo-endopeptidase [Chthoniobacterales bacterium]